MKKLYVVALFLHCLPIIAGEEAAIESRNNAQDIQTQRLKYRQEFDEALARKRAKEDLLTSNQSKARLKAQREQEDFTLQYQRAKEDGNKITLRNLRLDEDVALKAKRIKEDQETFSKIKNWWSRDAERAKEDEAIRAKRAQENEDIKQSKPSIKIEIEDHDIQTIRSTAHQLDHLLIKPEFKKIMSKLVDIESYQKAYHDLSIGRFDVDAFKKVQHSLKSDIKLSSDDIAIRQKYQNELEEILSHINSLFDTTNPIYQKIDDQLKNQQPPITFKNVSSILEKSIQELQKIDLTQINLQKAKYVLKESAFALLATPIVGLIVGISAVAHSLTLALISPHAAGGAIVLSTVAGIIAAPIVAASRFQEALNDYRYTITRDSFESLSKNSVNPHQSVRKQRQ
ncbi:MAG TPA: hypothetical protein VLG50_08790 [Candidatus Saccharimonadales bacterium]|nr:hypothetical protein [Candidatus Saccharimonadales bacterium]